MEIRLRVALEARSSGKISAIKMYRRETGADLREVGTKSDGKPNQNRELVS